MVGGLQEEAHARGGGEGDVVGAPGALQHGVRERLGDRLVQLQHVHLGAALSQHVGEHVAGASRAGDQRAPHRHLRQRLRQPLGDRALGHHVGADPALGERGCRACADRGHARAGQRARVAPAGSQPFEQSHHAVGAGDAHQIVRRWVKRRARERNHADRGRLHHARAQRFEPARQRAGLSARARHRDRAAGQGARRKPGELLGERRHRPHHGYRGRANVLGARLLVDRLQDPRDDPLLGQRARLHDGRRL